MERKPGMAAALTNAAIGHNILIRRDALTAVNSLQFICRLEGSIFTDSSHPGHVRSARDMPTTLSTLLGQISGCKQFATILGRGTDIDQGKALAAKRAEDLIAVGANIVIGFLSFVARTRIGGNFSSNFALIGK